MNFSKIIMHRDVTLVAKQSSNKLKYLKLKENEKLQKLLYCFKRSFQLGDKKFRVIYTLSLFSTWRLYSRDAKRKQESDEKIRREQVGSVPTFLSVRANKVAKWKISFMVGISKRGRAPLSDLLSFKSRIQLANGSFIIRSDLTYYFLPYKWRYLHIFNLI